MLGFLRGMGIGLVAGLAVTGLGFAGSFVLASWDIAIFALLLAGISILAGVWTMVHVAKSQMDRL